MPRSFLSSLRTRLILLVLLAIVPMFGLTLYAGLDRRRHEAAEALKRALTLARLAADEQKHVVEVTEQLLAALARLPQVRDGDPAACNSLLVGLGKQYHGYTGFGVARPDGEVFCNSTPFARTFNIAQSPYFQRALQTRAFAAGDYQIGRLSGKAVVIFAQPVQDDTGRLRAVVFAALGLAWLGHFVAEAQLPTDSSLAMIDTKGTVLIRVPDSEKWIGQAAPDPPVVQHILSRAGEGTLEAVGGDGISRLYGFSPIALLGASQGPVAYVYVGIPAEVAFAESRRSLARGLALLGLVTVLALGAAWVGGELFVLRSVRALVRTTGRLGGGNLSARTGLPHGQGEIGQLARAFDEMAGSLQARADETRQAEEELRRHAQRLAGLRAIDRAILAARSPQTIAQAALGHLRHLVHCQRASVALFDFDAGAVTLLAAQTDGDTRVGAGTRLSMEEYGLAGRLRQGQAEMVEDVQTLPWPSPVLQGLQAEGVCAYLSVPLVAQGQVIGSLNLGRGQAGVFPAEHVEIVREVADQLAVAIQDARLHEQVARHASQLEARVRERTRELALANEQLAAASRHKSEFLANMSHELRTPLNSVIGFAELLQGRAVGPLTEKQARYLGHIHTSGKHLLQLISDILDLSKVEAGKFDLKPQDLPVAQTVEDILVIARGLAHRKAQAVESDIEDGLPSLRADPVRFKQMLFNLLSNAVKFTPEKGTISVTARRLEGAAVLPSGGAAVGLKEPQHGNTAGPQHWLEMRVTDTGVGIKAEDLPRLFQEFVQLETTQTQRHEGTGLGLALTKRLVTLHGGRITAESAGEGRGSTFTLLLPLRGPEA